MNSQYFKIIQTLTLLLTLTTTAALGNIRNLSASDDDESSIKIVKSAELTDGFKLELGHEKEYPSFKSYGYVRLLHNGKKVFSDSTYEYESPIKLSPLVVQAGNNEFEVLLEVSDRPNKSYLKRLFISSDKVVKEDKLPTFIALPSDLNGDGQEEYAGYWAFNETWGENHEMTDYNPILYYTITKEGLKINKDYTRKQNDAIFGSFYGYEYSQDIDIPATSLTKHSEEIIRIRKASEQNNR